MVVCPRCNSQDMIQKASAVYSSGVGTGSFAGPTTAVTYSNGKMGVAGGYVSGTSHSISDSARKCAPPIKPIEPKLPFKVWLGIFIILCALCSLSLDAGGYALIPFSIDLLLIILGSSHKSNLDKKYPELLANYQHELEIWNKLYYCHRDDILFNPETEDIWIFN